MLLLWIAFFLSHGWCGSALESPVVVSLPAPINSIHPFTLDNGNFLVVTNLIVEKLVQLEDNGTWTPRLARSWSYSTDKKTFTFKLRHGVKFSDGQPLTASDVKFSYDMVFDPRYHGAEWQGMYAGVEKVEIAGPDEIRFHAKNVDFELWKMLATQLRIHSAHFFASTPPDSWNTTILGTGPYALAHFAPGGTLLLRQNPDWWGRRDPAYAKTHTFAQVLFRVQADPWTAAAMIRKKELDVFQMKSPADVERVEKYVSDNPGKVMYVRGHSPRFARTIGLEFNLQRPVLRSLKVRQALNHILNRDAISAKIFHGHWLPSLSYFGRTSPYFTVQHALSYDPKRARELLESDGWHKLSNSKLLVNAEGEPFKLQILYEDADLEPFLSLLQQESEKDGLHFDLQKIEPANTWKVLNEKKFDLFASISADWSTIIPSTIKSGAVYNFTGLSDQQIDHWADELPALFDPAKHLRTEKKIAARMDELVLKIVGFDASETIYLISPRLDVPKALEDRDLFTWHLKSN